MQPRAIEPLFAYNKRLWLRVWASTQAAALVVAIWTMLARAGGVGAFVASPAAPRSLGIIALLVAYHVVGIRAYDWILGRAWAVVLFVPLGWAIIIWSQVMHGAFGLLILGAIIQGFVFLPFAWAIVTLMLVIGLLLFLSLRASRVDVNLRITQAGGMLAAGCMIGTVMLYIHRVNRDSAIRARLLQQLDDAQRDLAERAKEAGVQEERQRLARDIHDSLAQGFASVIRHLEAIELSFASSDTTNDAMRGAAPHLAHAQAVSRTSLAEIRRLVWALRPAPLAESTLGAAIERIVAQWSDANNIAATCAIDALPALIPDADVIFLRATQEALSNVARHARATRVSISMHCVDQLVLLSIEDDGRGYVDADGAAAGKVGLTGMRERVRRFGGHVLIDSTPGAGTSITVAMPLDTITSAKGPA
jgi:signal transduction histidine kinase